MDFRILGRLEVLDGGIDIAPRRAQPRALLAMFLLHPNETISTDRLVEALWGETPPATSEKALQGHVSTLRKVLGASRLATERGGYRLDVQPAELDLHRFTSAVGAARAETTAQARARGLGEALAIWGGEPLEDLASERFAQAEIGRLADLRVAAIEAWADAELELGQHGKVLPELERLVARNPLNEGVVARLMLAMYRAGRQADALRTYRDARRGLVEELGMDPGTELQLLERQILAHDPAIDAPAVAPPPAPTLRQERKTVTVLVVEVVPDRNTDPEDLEREVEPAKAHIRGAIERAGGRAEPLFANALLGMFGAPRAHDDDPVRAVRTALAVLATGSPAGPRLRGGIDTGEALVTIDGSEVSITGQVLGAASMLQATAPLGTIVVGPGTHRATQHVVDYTPGGPGTWVPQGLRAAPDGARPNPPFVGRAEELGQLDRVFARAGSERTVQLATVVAEPGGGKSRLIGSSANRLTAGADGPAPRWLQGRCLPYGDGVTFWALGEIVKGWAGILESDDATASSEKLAAALTDLEPDDNRRTWLERTAGPLVGIDGSSSAGDREQAFAGWRRLIEAIARDQPLVVSFEDIHWADDALLAFIDDLVDHAAGVPLLVLCTARLELLDARPSWAGGKRNATTILLRPLRDAETRELLQSMLGREPDAETIRRAGGNPLYAHELARVIAHTVEGDASTIPESLQAVIAAHLDALTPDLKLVAADASVVGEVFWPGVIAEISGLDAAAVEARLHRLATNDVIRRRQRSSVAGEDEYEFLHVLVRDVAYGQIPRRDRIAKHRATAAWIERLAGDRIAAHAELVAHHAAEAVELAERFGGDEGEPEHRARAAKFLALAGDAARALDAARAEALYRRALELTEASDPGRGRLLARLGEVSQVTRSLAEAEPVLREAISALEAVGDQQAAGAAMVSLAGAMWRLGRADDERRQLLLGAIDVLEQLPPSTALVAAYAQMAAHELYGIRAAACRDWSLKALAVAEVLGDPVLKCLPRQYLGIARFELGDSGGIDDVRAASQLAAESGLSWEAGNAQADLGAILWLSKGPAAGLEMKQAAAAFVGDRGLAHIEQAYRADTLWYLYDAGDWDALLDSADALLAQDVASGTTRITLIAQSARARVLAQRGDTDAAIAVEADILQRARGLGDAQDVGPALGTAAAIRAAAGDKAGTLARIEELAAQLRGRDVSRRVHELPMVARLAAAAGAIDLVAALVPDPAEGEPPFARASLCIATGRAVIAEASGRLEDALVQYAALGVGWGTYGCPLEAAQALLGAARCLASLGRASEAARDLHAATKRASALGARPLLDAIAAVEARLAI